MQDFHMIASFLEHRSTPDCVQFFYKIQKLDDFALVRRKLQLKKRRQQSDANRSMPPVGESLCIFRPSPSVCVILGGLGEGRRQELPPYLSGRGQSSLHRVEGSPHNLIMSVAGMGM